MLRESYAAGHKKPSSPHQIYFCRSRTGGKKTADVLSGAGRFGAPLLLFLPLQIRAWGLQSQLKQLQGEKQALLIKQQQIQQQIGYYSSDAYVEEAARQDLGLVKPGEALGRWPLRQQAVAKELASRLYRPLRRLIW